MKNCLDDAGLQSFFDRELPSEMMEEVARHLASCISCAQAASEVEQENRLFVKVLEPEMSAAVPTEQLHARITAAGHVQLTAFFIGVTEIDQLLGVH